MLPMSDESSSQADIWVPAGLSQTSAGHETSPVWAASRELPEAASYFRLIFGSPFLWGTALTVLFYVAAPHLPIDQVFLYRYFCSHWVLYATTWLFGIGMAILAGKAAQIPVQRRALQLELLRGVDLSLAQSWMERLQRLRFHLQGLPRSLRKSALGERYTETCDYLAVKRSGATLEDHLKYLHDVATEAVSDSYSLIRTIIWAIPILGFLGTVIGITLAITSITPDQLESSMASVTSGLAVAFDTTALSLSLSMILVFASFLTERSEQQILGRIERVALREFAPLFLDGPAEERPLEQAERQAAEHLLQETAAMVHRQTEAWQASLLGMRSRWEATLERQEQQFATALQAGMQSTLRAHLDDVSQASRELLGGFRDVAVSLTQALAELQSGMQQRQAEQLEAQQAQWAQVREEFTALKTAQAGQWDELLDALTEKLDRWQTALQSATETGTSQIQELQSQGEVLLRIVSEETELARLQQTLADNLDSVRAVETFEETLHSLTAAVHLLTAKAKAA